MYLIKVFHLDSTNVNQKNYTKQLFFKLFLVSLILLVFQRVIIIDLKFLQIDRYPQTNYTLERVHNESH